MDTEVMIYNPKYPFVSSVMIDDLVCWFAEKPKFRIANEIIFLKGGDTLEKQVEVANAPPMLTEFCRLNGISYSKLKKAAKVIPELAEAFEECDGIVKEFFIYHGLLGNYSSQFGIFAAKNLTDMKDKQITEQRSVNINQLMDSIEKSTKAIDIESM